MIYSQRKIKFYIFIVIIAVIMIACSSCGSTKKTSYFQDIPIYYIDSISDIRSASQLQLKPNDELYINVSAPSKEAADLFNAVDVKASITTASLSIKAYLIDNNGCINFPVLGLVYLEGLTKEEAIELLQAEIAKYIIDPVVNIRLLNFNVSVLGEVARPGNYEAKGEVITLPQALSMAGDMTIYGVRDNVIIAREINGKQIFARINMTSGEIFNSPYFYLQQNDIIYVQPNKTKSIAASYNQHIPLALSILSTVITLFALILK